MSTGMSDLLEAVDAYMAKTADLRKFCDRCLETRRWGGDVVLMVIDAAFDSIGLNYFNSVVPKVMDFEKAFVETSEVQDLNDLKGLPYERVGGNMGK